MITAKEVINLYKQSRRDCIEEKIKCNARGGYTGYTDRTINIPWWLQEELKEAGFVVTFEGMGDSQINISWKEDAPNA